MKVFISSLISGFGSYRDAARRAVTTLRHEAVMAEDFGAQPNSSQIACLQGVRSADLVVLILGPDYGFVPSGSTLSATHQEYREARETRPILAFIQQGIDPQPEQKSFIDEVQAWEGGLFRSGFIDAADLQDGITRALHDFTLANAVGPIDQDQLVSQAVALIPQDQRGQSSSTSLEVSIVGGPTQRTLRPLQMEDPALGEHLEQSALYGENRLFDRTRGSVVNLDGSDLVVGQERGASIRLTEQGSMLFRLSLEDAESRDRMGGFGGLVIIEEVVRERLGAALGYAAATIERIDPTQRLTHLGVAAHISGAQYRAWQTRARQAASSGCMQMGMGQEERSPITMVVRRAGLRLDQTPLIEDILVPLRRQFSAG
jgi:hypothetical protein